MNPRKGQPRNLVMGPAALLLMATACGPASGKGTTPRRTIPEGAVTAEMSEPPVITDQTITMGITESIKRDPIISIEKVAVSTNRGIVILRGTVRHLRARERAAGLARPMKGVRSVINMLEISPVRRADEVIRSDIETAFRLNPALEKDRIEITVSAGKVVLQGMVDSHTRKMLAGDVVCGIRGVALLDNRLVVDPGDQRADEDIRRDVIARLDRDVRIDGSLIFARVKDGVVHLSGYASSAAEKAQAALDAWVKGVSGVKAHDIRITWPIQAGLKRRQIPSLTPMEVAKALKSTLVADPRVDAEGINVEVKKTGTHISGRVSSLQAKHSATQDAENTVGVVAVHNQLVVEPVEPVSDLEIKTRVSRSLEREPVMEGISMDVDVSDGMVTLSGEVPSAVHRKRAGRITAAVKGVRDLTMKLEIWPGAKTPSDAEVLSDLRNSLFWNAKLNPASIKITIRNGEVVLNGKVGSVTARREVVDAAYRAGARAVNDDLEINLDM